MQHKSPSFFNISIFLAITLCFVVSSLFFSIVFVVYFLGYVLTLLALSLLCKNTKEYIDTTIIFSTSILIGFILALANNIDYLQNGTPYLYPDQVHFFDEARSLANQSNSALEVIKSVNDGRYIEYLFVYSMFGLFAYIDKIVSGSVNFLPLLYSVVYFTALIPVFLYHIVKLYLPSRLSFNSSLIYGVLMPIMAYSGYLLRDMHITLVTIITLYLVVRQINISRIIFIIVLILVAYGMRASSSLLILAMLIIWVFAGKSNKFIKISTFFIVGVFLVIFSNDIISTIGSTSRRLDNYDEFTQLHVEKANGISSILYKLPPVIKEISIIIFSLSAFPFYSNSSNVYTLPQGIMFAYNFITNIAWFFVFCGFFYFIKPIIKKLYSLQNKIFIWLLVLAFVFLYINTSNMTFRRLLSVLPFIYIPFLFVYNDLTLKEKNRYIIFVIFSAFSLQFFYFLLTIF